MHKFQKALLITALASNLSMTKAQLFSDVLYSMELLLSRKMDITLECCCHTVNNDTLLLQLCISSKYLRTYSKWQVIDCLLLLDVIFESIDYIYVERKTYIPIRISMYANFFYYVSSYKAYYCNNNRKWQGLIEFYMCIFFARITIYAIH